VGATDAGEPQRNLSLLAGGREGNDYAQERPDHQHLLHFREVGEEFIGPYCASKFGVIGLTQLWPRNWPGFP